MQQPVVDLLKCKPCIEPPTGNAKATSMFLISKHSVYYGGEKYRLPSPTAEQLRCKICQRLLRTLGEHNEHMFKHTKVFNCYRCNDQFAERDLIRKHLQTCRVVPSYARSQILKIAGKRQFLSTKDSMQTSRKWQRKAKYVSLVSHVGAKSTMLGKVKRTEEKSNTLSLGAKNYQREQTPYTIQDLKRLPIVDFKCPLCHKQFSNKANAKRHLMLHAHWRIIISR